MVWFEFDCLALQIFWVRGRSHGFTVRYSDDFDGWDTLDGKPC